MSEIRDPAQTGDAMAPGDEGHQNSPGDEVPPASAGEGNLSSPPESPTVALDQDETQESPEDSIGNRIDASSSPSAGTAGTASGKQGKKKKKKRRKDTTAQQRPTHESSGETRRPFHVGDKVRAKIVSVGPAGAMVDLWGKDQGVIDLRELITPEQPEVRVGDVIPEVVILQDGSRGGNVVVTRDPSRSERSREMVVQAFNSNEPIEGLVTGVNRGGLEVDLSGIRGFCPASQIDLRFPPTVHPKSLVLTRQFFKITSLVDNGREAIVSRRAVLEQEARARAEKALANITVGSVVKGTVVSVKDYGVFLDLGGVEGMIHISELTHNRSARPSDIVKVGDEIEGKVLRITRTHTSQEQPDDATIAESQSQGDTDTAETTPVEEKTKGKKSKKKARQRLQGEPLPRVILSRRAIEPDPWEGIAERYRVGSVHTGKVARMQPFGAFVELEPGIDGLLHVSELGDGKRIDHPNQVLKEGQTVTVQIERIEPEARRIALSLLPDGVTEEQLKNAVVPRVGMICKATVVEHDAHGFWVQIEGAIGKGSRGYISAAESGQPRGTELRKVIPVGTTVTAKITEMERGWPKLSIRAAEQEEERRAYRAYQKEATSKSVSVSLADKLRGLIGNR